MNKSIGIEETNNSFCRPNIEWYKVALERWLVKWPVGNVYYDTKNRVLRFINWNTPVENRL